MTKSVALDKDNEWGTKRPDVPQHVVQRGSNRWLCFLSDHDYTVYTNIIFLRRTKNKYLRLTHLHYFDHNG